MHRRRALTGLMVAGALAALPFLPLPSACDPRLEEVPATRYGELRRFSGARTRAEIEAALRVVDPHQALRPYLLLTDQVLEARLSPGGPAAVRIPLRPPDSQSPSGPARAAERIALDPGHSGGLWSRLEQRHVERGGPLVREGNLSWATARLAERDLRAAGAEVRLLRGPPPSVPFDAGAIAGFDPGLERRFWLAENHQTSVSWLSPWSALALWREGRDQARAHPYELFTRFELRRRAVAASAFGADVTLSLHYNYTLTGRNGVLVFVPGNFLPDELQSTSERFWALRRVLDGTLPRTLALASALGQALSDELGLPPLADEASPGPRPAWLPVDLAHGVFARNLAIPRRAPGVVLVLEGPCVNEPEEYRRLAGTELEIDGQRYPARVKQYADAVVAGLQAWSQIPAAAP